MNSDPPLCCKTADIILKDGKVSFGLGCIVHPKAKIITEGDCSIIFGEYNIIEENVVIKASPKFNPLLNQNETITMYIGNYNHFKVGCFVENTSIENYNVLDYRCKMENSYIGSKNIINPAICLPKGTGVKHSIVLDNQLVVPNNNFNENEFITLMKGMYKTLANLLPKQNTMHNINLN
jgi:carbonic anhydrase/acetyltransferase-like protein (isoleucine patch superfamily)